MEKADSIFRVYLASPLGFSEEGRLYIKEVLIPKKLELLDNIAHAAMAGMIKIRAADPVKPRT